ncbi:hypothetical protein [Streptomyces sp. NPDC058667]|uniref:hypothetical protein n=1 Tax=Streptomyces sp. NPDC058667 TaxID=3346588 RepID=UPI00364FD08E
MDQELVALVAAGVGLVGAIGGAAIGGMAAARGARIGAETAARATATQVRDQARYEHAHWLRERRLEACRDVLAAYDEYVSVSTAFARQLDADPELAEHVTLHPPTLALNRNYIAIRILGPQELRQAAWLVKQKQQDHMEALYAWKRVCLTGGDQEVVAARAQAGAAVEPMAEAHSAFVTVINQEIATPE